MFTDPTILDLFASARRGDLPAPAPATLGLPFRLRIALPTFWGRSIFSAQAQPYAR